MPGFNIGYSDPTQTSHVLSDVKEAYRSNRWKIVQIVGENLKRAVYVKSTTLPKISFEEEIVEGASIQYKFPKAAKFDDITITFYDVLGLHNSLRTQILDKSWTPEEGLKGPMMGLTTIELEDGNGNALATWDLYNSWLKSLEHSEMSYDRGDIKTVSVIIAYSWAKYVASEEQINAGVRQIKE